MKLWPFRTAAPELTQEQRVVAALTAALEERGVTLENPAISLADPRAYEAIFGSAMSASGVTVTPEVALGIPAFWCAVNFIAGTIASLPLILYKKSAEGRDRSESDPLYAILHDVVNEDKLTSFWWRKNLMVSTMLYGRSFTFIERNRAGRVMNFWPLDTRMTTVQRRNGRKVYVYMDGGRQVIYESAEIIDIPWMLGPDGVTTIDPLSKLADALGLTVSLGKYAAKFFQNGGVPALSMQGPVGSPAAAARAANDVDSAVKRANEQQRNVVTMPTGYQLKPIGYNPSTSQMVEARGFQIEEVARIFSLPPVFLQDLSNGTYANTEQQDLHFVKHTLMQWLQCLEGELNAKVISSGNRTSFIEFQVDGLLRGDFSTRMQGYATGIQNAVITPDEARKMENRPPKEGGDSLFIQGATVPITDVGTPAAAAAGSTVKKVGAGKKPKTPAPAPDDADLDPAVDLTGSDDE